MSDDRADGRAIRAGIIGPHGIGTVHCTSLRDIGIEVVAVASSSEERARAHAARLGVPLYFGDAEQLIQSPDVDTVHICTPNDVHAPLCRAALAAGKHVICEKPLATTVDDARDLLRLARQSNLVHAVCYTYRYYTLPRLLRAWVNSGKLGRVHLIQGSFLLEEVLLIENPAHWMLDPARIGPSLSLADIGVHWWDMVEFVSGQRIMEVVSARQAVRGDAGPDSLSDDSAAILCRLDGGAVASAIIGQAAPGHTNTFALDLIGTAASASWNQESVDELHYRPLNDRPRTIQRTDLAVDEFPTASAAREEFDDAFRIMMADIYAPIRHQTSSASYPTFADGVRGVEILAAVLRSAADHRWVNCEIADGS